MKRNNCFIRILASLLAALILASPAACTEKLPADSDSAVVMIGGQDKPVESTIEPIWDTSETEATPAPSGKSVTFLACGDNIIHDAIIFDAQKRANDEHPNYNFYDMYSEVAPLIEEADISYINMEGCVAGASFGYKGYPDFNAPNEIGTTLVELGFDVVNIANNHMLDYYEAGLAKTIEFFKSLPVTLIGGYTKSDYDELRIVEKNGIRVAFLSYITQVNVSRSIPSGSKYVLPYAVDEDITRQVRQAQANADFVIVVMHWGKTDEFSPNAEQKRLAQLCADLGVDVVVGSHSHTIQPTEWVTGSGGNRTLVTYSLGNFISTMYYAQNIPGSMLSLTLNIDASGEKSVSDVRIIPTLTHYSMKRDSVQVYLLSDYSEELAKQHGSNQYNAFTYEIVKRYFNVVPAEFLR